MPDIISLILFGSLLLIMLAGIIMSFMLIHKQQIRQYQMKMKENEYRYHNEILQTRVEVQEQAFNWISREIHDNVGQVLSIIRMQLSHTGHDKTKEEMMRFMQEAGDVIERSINDLRNLSHLLCGEMVEKLDLPEAIEKELTYIRSLYRLDCQFKYTGEMSTSAGEWNLLLFRIIQEALNNIVTHAAATEIGISLLSKEDFLQMKIVDNGKGFDAGAPHAGLGLISMRHRVELLQGRLNIRSTPGVGTCITITINPLKYERTIN